MLIVFCVQDLCVREQWTACDRMHTLRKLVQLLDPHRSLFLKLKWLHYVQFLIPKKPFFFLANLSGCGVRGKE